MSEIGKDIIDGLQEFSHAITEDEVHEASGDELNKLVELWCNDDDLSCFEADGTVRPERITKALRAALEYRRNPGGYFLLGKQISHGPREIRNDYLNHLWIGRREGIGDIDQSDLEAHVNNWRAKARDFEGDANLAMSLWEDPAGPFNCDGIGYYVLYRSEEDEQLCHWVARDFLWHQPGGWKESIHYPSGDSAAQAICRAAVILELESEVKNA